MDQEKYKKTIWTIAGDAWKFFKEHLPTREDDNYWDEVVNYYSELSRRYKGTRFYGYACDTSLMYLDELQRLWREKHKEDAA